MMANATVVQTLFVFAAIVLFGGLAALVVGNLLGGETGYNRNGIRLGGAAAVFFLVIWSLIKVFPSIFTTIKAEAGTPPVQTMTSKGIETTYPVSLQATQQIVLSTDLAALDRNQYEVDDELQIAVPRPHSVGWEVYRGPVLKNVTAMDLPTIQLVGSMMGIGSSDTKTFGIKEAQPHEITLEANSTIDGLKASFNMFDDKAFVKKSMQNNIKFTAALMGMSKEDQDQQLAFMENEEASLHKKRKIISKASCR
jgi:hypothetical protein